MELARAGEVWHCTSGQSVAAHLEAPTVPPSPVGASVFRMLLDSFVLGLAVLFTAQLVRALPWPEAWLKSKPLSCHVCMSWHCATVWWIGLVVMETLKPSWTFAGMPPITTIAAAAGFSYLWMHALDWLQAQSVWSPPK